MNTTTIPVTTPTNTTQTVSWGAIIAGVIIALLTQTLFNLLGLSLGFISFAMDQDTISKIGIGSIIWLILTGILSMYVGGWVSSRLANLAESTMGILYGITTGGLAIILSFLLMVTTAGALISSVANIAVQTVSFAGKSVVDVGKGVTKAAPRLIQMVQVISPDIQASINPVIQQANNFLVKAQNTLAKNVQTEPQDLDKLKKQLRSLVQSFLTAENEQDKKNVREELVSFLAEYTQIDQNEINQTIDNWQNKYNQLREQVSEKVEQTKQSAIETTEQATRATGKITFIIFLILLIDVLASAVGGRLGVRGVTSKI